MVGQRDVLVKDRKGKWSELVSRWGKFKIERKGPTDAMQVNSHRWNAERTESLQVKAMTDDSVRSERIFSIIWTAYSMPMKFVANSRRSCMRVN